MPVNTSLFTMLVNILLSTMLVNSLQLIVPVITSLFTTFVNILQFTMLVNICHFAMLVSICCLQCWSTFCYLQCWSTVCFFFIYNGGQDFVLKCRSTYCSAILWTLSYKVGKHLSSNTGRHFVLQIWSTFSPTKLVTTACCRDDQQHVVLKCWPTSKSCVSWTKTLSELHSSHYHNPFSNTVRTQRVHATLYIWCKSRLMWY